MKNYLLILAFMFIYNIIIAQCKDVIPESDTLISVFDPSNEHKDGYEIDIGNYISLPYKVVSTCANKKIRIIGKRYNHVVTADDLKFKNEDGDTVWMQGRVGAYSTFLINNISVWESKKKSWKVIYVNEKGKP